MPIMSQWNVKAPTLCILSCLAFLMVLILVLPDVDLPDTAFHRGTAPTAVHSQATAAPTATTVAAVIEAPIAHEPSRQFFELGAFAVSPDPNFRPILLRSIRR